MNCFRHILVNKKRSLLFETRCIDISTIRTRNIAAGERRIFGGWNVSVGDSSPVVIITKSAYNILPC